MTTVPQCSLNRSTSRRKKLVPSSPTPPQEPERVPLDLLPKYDRWIKEAKARGTICFTPAELRIMRGALADWRSLAAELARHLKAADDELQTKTPPDGRGQAKCHLTDGLKVARDAGLLGSDG